MITVVLVLRSQLFEYLRETLYKHALEPLEAARSEKMGIFWGAVAKTRCTLLEYGQSKVKGRNESQTSTTEAE